MTLLLLTSVRLLFSWKKVNISIVILSCRIVGGERGRWTLLRWFQQVPCKGITFNSHTLFCLVPVHSLSFTITDLSLLVLTTYHHHLITNSISWFSNQSLHLWNCEVINHSTKKKKKHQVQLHLATQLRPSCKQPNSNRVPISSGLLPSTGPQRSGCNNGWTYPSKYRRHYVDFILHAGD